MTRIKTLLCPSCDSDALATVEDMIGSAHGGAHVELDASGNEIGREFDHEGWTEVHWDSSVSTAVECRECGWRQAASHDGPALNELKVEVIE